MQPHPSTALHPPLQETALGQYMAGQEAPVYAQAVADVFGFHAVQIGWPTLDLLQDSRIPYKHAVQTQLTPLTSVQAESEYLPFAEQSVDLVCLPHVLEQCADPQQTLREALRVLVPEGTLMLSGISPLSCLGVRARMGEFGRQAGIQRLLTAWRMRDWLSVLGFEVVHSQCLMHAFPLNDALWLSRQAWLERYGQRSCGMTGGVYFIVAKKRVLHMRLLKPDWKKPALHPGLQVQKGGSRMQKGMTGLQKQIECADDESSVDRNVR